MLELEVKDGAVHFLVKVQTRAQREGIAGEHARALKVRLIAPAVEGRANEALIELLAKHLKVPRASIKILRGERAPRKLIAVAGVTPEQVRDLVREKS